MSTSAMEPTKPTGLLPNKISYNDACTDSDDSEVGFAHMNFNDVDFGAGVEKVIPFSQREITYKSPREIYGGDGGTKDAAVDEEQNITKCNMAKTTECTLLQSLENRVAALEQSSWQIPAGDDKRQGDDVATTNTSTPAMRRARRHVESGSSPCYSALWKWCPTNYYSLTLDERVVILGAGNKSQLCKACLFENRSTSASWPSNSDAKIDRTDSNYYLVVVQYVESIDMKKLGSELRGLRPAGKKRLDPSNFADLRLAPEDDSARLTGYAHNGVSPFGLADARIPVVVCSSLLEARPSFMWMGGGGKDLKLGMAVSEFVKGVDAIVLDVSEPRA